MNRIEAIKCQIRQIAEHITGPEGYSIASLSEIRAELLDAFNVVDAEIIKREKAPYKGILANLGKPEGGAA